MINYKLLNKMSISDLRLLDKDQLIGVIVWLYMSKGEFKGKLRKLMR